MTRKVLDGLGVLALLIFVGGGILAWTLVKQRIGITIQEGGSRQGDDQVALLRDEVREFGKELRSLREGLGKSLVSMAQAQGKDLEERDRALTGLEARLMDRIAGLDKAAAVTQVPTVQPQSRPASLPESVAKMASPPKKRGSFLAFDLPSSEFRFEGLQTFEVVPSLSRVGFDAKSTLHDFTGATTEVSGELTTDLSDPVKGAKGRIAARTKALDTGLADRNAAMLENLDAERHQTIEFVLESFTASAVDSKAMKLAGTASGTMTIRGKTRPFTIPVTASVDESKRLGVVGECMLGLSDYDVVVPNKLGLVKMDGQVKIWIALRLRVGVPRK